MTNSSWITLFQWVSFGSSLLALISFIGLWVFSDREAAQKDAEIQRLTMVTEAVRGYSDVAQLNPTGLPFREGSGIRFDSPLSSALRNLYVVQGSKIHFKMGEEYEGHYREIIKNHPRFPFAYLALSESLRSRNDLEWMDFAERAIEILEKTTLLDGHDAAHDDALQVLRRHLADGKKSK